MAFKRKRMYVPRTRKTGYRLRGRGAYRMAYAPRRRTLRGRGGYYFSGGAYARGKVPYLGQVGGALNAGYSRGKVSAPKLQGLGSYSVSNIRHNVLIKPDIPAIYNTVYAEGGTIVRHREYLGPVVTSSVAGEFKINSYPLNPAQSKTFPWLSAIAAQFEEYKPNGLMFEYKSTASDAIASSTNLALGQCMLCTQYDPTDPEFISDVQLLNYTWAQSGKVSDNIQHFVECDPKQSPLSHLYTREGAPSDDADLRFSDFGRFSIATSGLQGTNVQIGQLWVTYEFIMYKPKLGDAGAEAGGWFHYYNDTGVGISTPFGTVTSGKYDDQNNLGVTVYNSGGHGFIAFDGVNIKTTYMLTVSYDGSAALVNGPTFGGTTDSGIQFVDLSKMEDDPEIRCPEGLTGDMTNICTVAWIDIVGDGNPHLVQLDLGNIPGGPQMDLYISQIPYYNPQF